MIRRLRVAALVGIALAASVASGCSQLPFHDDSYKTAIPAALEGADLGITDAWAGVSLSGFTETLSIGGTLSSLEQPGDEVSPQTVAQILGVALHDQSLSMSYVELALRNADDDLLEVDSALKSLGAHPRGDGSITMDEAKKIAEESGR
ncbi:hypothetical protein [Microbacterium testaceum]|uniref:hypothetical protein n=1 Tax=Microbacterium testaceum TaxID=2033 RepID=UPI002AC693BB|nr:hypothetical protein [Microbacterium testaceum]MDZ5144174.1 hypothetical protein [Microbacterium testaceum]